MVSIFVINEVEKLKQIAERIQWDETVGLPEEDIEKLRNYYHAWFGKCLSLLPEEIKGEFRSAYAGTVWTPKIKQFLEAPTEPNPYRPKTEIVEKDQLSPWAYPYGRTFYPYLMEQKAILKRVGKRKPKPHVTSQDIEKIKLLIQRFDSVARQLEQRRSGQEPLVVSNEYDIQYLFRALLRLFFEDVRPEEWTPSYAGGHSCIDFLLKSEQIAIEIKMTRLGLKEKDVRDQLILDIHRYHHTHPDCKALVAFVYDRDRHIDNPRSFERDLSQPFDGMAVIVFISPS